ncbi:acyl-CoA thioesterase [Burkholderia catarinensis]|uniref:acyl-CoA thioesterase n=1 Tax=Burkholderia catarinensis TaxID=1108140 RepID=UPI0009123153|nr:thioesterase family protein [Burkholderia catarinensis]KAG8148558.1 4-hydroxybenzoyl-CoA thioesterase [Burkholderia catarinensis]
MNPRKLTQTHRIRFAECDPAGIVFYPQYFVMFNNLLEAWIDGLLPEGFAGYIGKQRFGLPTVRLEADFRAISRMGDDVELSLEVLRLGGKSLTLSLSCIGSEGDIRMSVTQVLVSTSLDTHQAIDIPDMLRRALSPEPVNE